MQASPAAAAPRASFLGVERSLGGKRWESRLADERLALTLAQRLDLPELVGRVLAARSVDLDGAASFLEPRLRDLLPDPSHLKDMDAAVARLTRALQAGESIAVFGDYDVDGATSSALLQRFLRAVGADLRIYMPDRLAEHPASVVVLTNLYYGEAPKLMPSNVRTAAALNWHEIALTGDSAYDYDEQIKALGPLIADSWQVTASRKTGNPLYVRPSVLVLYRKDQAFLLDSVIPRPGAMQGLYDLIIASQPYRARTSAALKVRKVLAPLASALGPSGRMLVIQSHGRDPGMEIVNKVWPEEDPFQSDRHALLKTLKQELSPTARDLAFNAPPDERSLFQYRMHSLPSDFGESIGTSALFAAWNAAVYVAQIEGERLSEAMKSCDYLAAAEEVLHKHGGLWFWDESFVITRRGR